MISGLGVPLLWFAYLNRAGPGTVCETYPGGQSCTDQTNPWPWLAVGGALLLVGVLQFRLQQTRSSVHRSV